MKIKYVLTTVMLLVFIVLCNSYFTYILKGERLNNHRLKIEVHRVVNEYLNKSYNDLNVEKFMSYSSKNFPSIYDEIIENEWSLGFKEEGDSLLVYENGPDMMDNNGLNIMTIKDYNFSTYLLNDSIDIFISKLQSNGNKIDKKIDLMREISKNEIKDFKRFSDSLNELVISPVQPLN